MRPELGPRFWRGVPRRTFFDHPKLRLLYRREFSLNSHVGNLLTEVAPCPHWQAAAIDSHFCQLGLSHV